MISSSSNAQIKNIVKLQKQAKARKEQGLFVVEGKKMVEEAMKTSSVSVKKVFLTQQYMEACSQGVLTLLSRIEYEIVSEAVMKDISETMTPQGVVAVVEQPKYTLDQMLASNRVRLLLLEDINDPGNLGTIIRTAEGVGISGVIMSRDTVDIYNPKVIRSTMGAIYRVPFFYSNDFLDTIEWLRSKEISIYAAYLKGAVMYDRVTYSKRSAIMIGNEANGLTESACQKADYCIKIPMEGKVESLNAGIAAAVFMYELYRQERNN